MKGNHRGCAASAVKEGVIRRSDRLGSGSFGPEITSAQLLPAIDVDADTIPNHDRSGSIVNCGICWISSGRRIESTLQSPRASSPVAINDERAAHTLISAICRLWCLPSGSHQRVVTSNLSLPMTPFVSDEIKAHTDLSRRQQRRIRGRLLKGPMADSLGGSPATRPGARPLLSRSSPVRHF